MKSSENSLFVSLTGGLGNQLFQLAAGMALAKDKKLTLVNAYGIPRNSLNGLPDLLSFELPEHVFTKLESKSPFFVQKTVGYLLRMGVIPRFYEKNLLSNAVLSALGNFVLSIHLKTFIKICFSRGVGYSDILIPAGNCLLVGYFQSYRWASECSVRNNLYSLRIKKYDPEILELQELSRLEKPLVVHIRLGDYKQEDSFGIPSKEYYEKSIEKMFKSGNYKKIWVFSDEMELAKEILPKDIVPNVRWINEINNSSASTLEAMRFGHGYVIGNSSFSWWGAFLSYTPNPEVIAPTPWFKAMASPIEIIPPQWTQVLAGY